MEWSGCFDSKILEMGRKLDSSCTCATFTYYGEYCRHIASLMFGWESLRQSREWYEFFHKYKTCNESDLPGIKHDIDNDIDAWKEAAKAAVRRGAPESYAYKYWAIETLNDYIWGTPFRDLEKRGNYRQIFEIYRYIAEKISKVQIISDIEK